MRVSPDWLRTVKIQEFRHTTRGRGPRLAIRDYDLLLVDPAPLPPHERPWRHPSEVGPTRLDVDGDGGGRLVVIAAGTLAALLVVAMIVAVTPRQSDGPVAVSATTTPATPATSASPTTSPPDAQASTPAVQLVSIAAIPNAVAAGPVGARAARAVADDLPDANDPVLVRTDSVTYRIAWADLARIELAEDAVVIDRNGEMVARIEDGEIVVVAD